MAILKDLTTGATIPLAARIVVGRATTASLRLVDKRVSGEHATVRWTGSGWEVRDLGSRNGTFVGGVRVGPGEAAGVKVGTQLSFGDQEARYELVDAAAPGPVARDLRTNAWVAAEDGMLALPSSAQPECVVYGDPAGGWFAEGDDRRPVTDGDVLEIGGVPFALALPEMVDGTATVERAMRLDTIGLRFGVSRDEEHVVLTVVHRGEDVPLEPREHGYVLLTLARQRLDDAGEPSAEQGWIDRDRLLKMLQLDANGLNVAIYRARGQLASIGVDDAAGIVEVRRGQRRIGIPPERLEVKPLE
ncbi:MAG: FHA domain-containing protein [Myxococcota bacterium]